MAEQVSTHSRPKAAGSTDAYTGGSIHGFNTQPPEGGWMPCGESVGTDWVSTHSRPKAAGGSLYGLNTACSCFNTQPPEGGWVRTCRKGLCTAVSTHSRPKAAGAGDRFYQWQMQFQHTAARRRLVAVMVFD
ncbi:hypothetical protein NEIMUCOT_06682 [Neisseria mucosa ATCC 25996]|uniref:Uncharacterized protein n=1 Tax=Neisseria mucosa (strain ATCC 25996 / DSM 4631 / NCTC 10774 / M26) TaxID=546266 RepID=D3A188_NEIM2|nr:hypothetical protein NEIMUCOT_06682 [Neisseria mucosa ATCC 25996]